MDPATSCPDHFGTEHLVKVVRVSTPIAFRLSAFRPLPCYTLSDLTDAATQWRTRLLPATATALGASPSVPATAAALVSAPCRLLRSRRRPCCRCRRMTRSTATGRTGDGAAPPSRTRLCCAEASLRVAEPWRPPVPSPGCRDAEAVTRLSRRHFEPSLLVSPGQPSEGLPDSGRLERARRAKLWPQREQQRHGARSGRVSHAPGERGTAVTDAASRLGTGRRPAAAAPGHRRRQDPSRRRCRGRCVGMVA
jgi:hypothetical protein